MSSYKIIYILVEGEDDKKFIEKILKPKLKEKYNEVKIYLFANKRKDKINNLIKSIDSQGNEYIYMTDINDSPCITEKKERIKRRLININKNRILVVIKEIESWIFAGLNKESFKKLKIKKVPKMSEITKEQFNALIPKRYTSRIDFILEIYKNYSINIAKNNNKSFKYFLDKYDC